MAYPDNVDFYEYIALQNPKGAVAVIKKFGYRPEKVYARLDLAVVLKQLVREQGQPALLAIADQHPDKELLQTLFSASWIEEEANPKQSIKLPSISFLFQPKPLMIIAGTFVVFALIGSSSSK